VWSLARDRRVAEENVDMRNPLADEQLDLEPATPEKWRHAQLQGYQGDVDMSACRHFRPLGLPGRCRHVDIFGPKRVCVRCSPSLEPLHASFNQALTTDHGRLKHLAKAYSVPTAVGITLTQMTRMDTAGIKGCRCLVSRAAARV
jgi:hypothetical protein